MTKTIKANLMRVLMVIVALSCAFGIITMPTSTVKADASTPALEDFYVDENVLIRGDNEETSGMRFVSVVSKTWFEEFKALSANSDKTFRFGIVIDTEKTPTVNGENAITVSYLTDSSITFDGNGLARMNASITYNVNALKEDLKKDEGYVGGLEGDALEEKLESYVLQMNATRLSARGYVQVLNGEEEVVNTVYTENTVTRSMMEVTNGKLQEGVIPEEDVEWITTKYIAAISDATGVVDMSNGKVYGVDFTAYNTFAVGQQPVELNKSGSLVQFTEDALKVVTAKYGNLVTANDYTFTAFDSKNNALNVTVKACTRVITTADEIEEIFDLSDFQPDVKRYANGSAGETIIRSVDGYYVLGCDIDASVTKDGDALYMHHNLIPQADANSATQRYGGIGFKGTFDGRGYTISNLNLVRTATKTPYIYELRNNALGGRVYYGTDASAPTTSTYYASFKSGGVTYSVARTYRVAFDTSLDETQSNGAGLFGALDNAVIKNVAFTNVVCDNGNVLAKVGTNTKQQTAFLQEIDVATIKQATGKEGIYSYVGGTFVKEEDTAKISVQSLYNKTTNPDGGADWTGYGTFITNVYVEISKNSTKIRGAMWDEGGFSNSTLTNVVVEYLGGENEITQAKLDASKGVRNGALGGRFETADKATNSESFNNVVIIAPYYPVLASSAGAANVSGQNDKYMYYGENEVGKADFFGTGVVPAVGADDNNRTLKGVNKFVSYEEYYKGVNGVLTDTDGDPETPDELVYSKASNYDATIFNSKYWSNIMGVPSWRSALDNSLVVTANGEEIADGYTIAADRTNVGNTYTIAVKDVIGNEVEGVTYATSNDKVATFVDGVITITGISTLDNDVAELTFTVDGYAFTINVNYNGYQLIETAITYSEKNQLFDFGDHVIDPDGVQDSGDEIVLTNETVESITVLADTGAIELTRTERVVDTVTYVDFGGWTVPFTVEKGEDGYITTPFSSKLLVKVQTAGKGTDDESDDVFTSFIATNFTAYTGILTKATDFDWLLFTAKTNASINGYFIMANDIASVNVKNRQSHNIAGSSSSDSAFTGVFDGQGYVLSGLDFNNNGSLFGLVRSTAKQLTSIKNFALTGTLYSRDGMLVTTDPQTDVTDGSNAVEFKNIYAKNTSTKKDYRAHPGAGLIASKYGTASPTIRSFKMINVVADYTTLNTYDDSSSSTSALGDIYRMAEFNNTGMTSFYQFGMLTSEHYYGGKGIGIIPSSAYSYDMFTNCITISRTPAMYGVKGTSSGRPAMTYGYNKIGDDSYPILVAGWNSTLNTNVYTLAKVSDKLEVIGGNDPTVSGYGYRSPTNSYTTDAGADGVLGTDDDVKITVYEYFLKGVSSYDDANDIAAAITANENEFKAVLETGFFKLVDSGTGKMLTWHTL